MGLYPGVTSPNSGDYQNCIQWKYTSFAGASQLMLSCIYVCFEKL